MAKKGNKIWWKCNRYGFYVYNDMCLLACLDEEISECTDKREKPNRSEAPINEVLERTLRRHLESIKEKKDGFTELKKRAVRKRVI